MSRSRGLAALAALTVAVGIGLAVALHSSAARASARVGHLVLPVPSGFNSYRVPMRRGVGEQLGNRVITDFRVPDQAPPGWSSGIERMLSRWGAAQFKFMAVKHHDYGPPADGVALQLSWSDSQWCRFTCPPPKLHLPLTQHQPWYQEHVASGARSYRWGELRFHGGVYYVMYWLGPNASAHDRAAVLRALRSIRPAR